MLTVDFMAILVLWHVLCLKTMNVTHTNDVLMYPLNSISHHRSKTYFTVLIIKNNNNNDDQ